MNLWLHFISFQYTANKLQRMTVTKKNPQTNTHCATDSKHHLEHPDCLFCLSSQAILRTLSGWRLMWLIAENININREMELYPSFWWETEHCLSLKTPHCFATTWKHIVNERIMNLTFYPNIPETHVRSSVQQLKLGWN